MTNSILSCLSIVIYFRKFSEIVFSRELRNNGKRRSFSHKWFQVVPEDEAGFISSKLYKYASELIRGYLSSVMVCSSLMNIAVGIFGTWTLVNEFHSECQCIVYWCSCLQFHFVIAHIFVHFLVPSLCWHPISKIIVGFLSLTFLLSISLLRILFKLS